MCAGLCLTLCDPMDYSPPGSSVHEISQARILTDPGIEPASPALAGRLFCSTTLEAQYIAINM